MLVIALAAIVIGGIVLRVVGLGYGLPAIYNPDEVAIMNRALGFARGDLNPHNFLYPTFYFYALFAWECAWFLLGRVIGVFASLADFERGFFVDPSLIYLAGRALSVACGAATLLATWRLGTRLFGRDAGLAAAALLAVAPLAVRDAHYVKHDVPVTLLVVLVHGVLARLVVPDAAPHAVAGREHGNNARLARSTRRGWLLAGALAGLAMATHYYAVFLVVPLTLAALMPSVPSAALQPYDVGARGSAQATNRRPGLRALALAALACLVTFAAASPFVLLEPATTWRDVVANRQIVVDRVTQATGALGSLGFYVRLLTREAAGAVTFCLAVPGIVVVMASGRRRAVVLLSFPVAFLLFIANTFPASRYLNPIVPFVAVTAGASVAWLAGRGRIGRLAAIGVCALAVVEATSASLHTDLFFRRVDTRTQAQAWIEREIPPGASILVQPYSVPLRPSREALTEALTANLGSIDKATVRFQRQLALAPYPSPAYRTIFLGSGGLDADKIYIAPGAIDRARSLAPLRALAVTYVVLKRYNVADPAMSSLDLALRQEGRLLATFSPYRAGVDPVRQAATAPFLHNTDARIDAALERPGPTVEIWTTAR
ncbi:MAG: glycosyltransferase family 39 protein [Acidobacteriota bacterium]